MANHADWDESHPGVAGTESAPVVIRMGVTPVPVIVLLTFLCFCKVVILFVVFLEVPPVSLILIRIPFVRILVRSIFIAPALFIILPVVVPVVTVLGASQYGQSQSCT